MVTTAASKGREFDDDDSIDGPAFERAIRRATRRPTAAPAPVLNLDTELASAACEICAVFGRTCCKAHRGQP